MTTRHDALRELVKKLGWDISSVRQVAERRSDPDRDHLNMLRTLREWEQRLAVIHQEVSALLDVFQREEKEVAPCGHTRLVSERVYRCKDCGVRGPLIGGDNFKPFHEDEQNEPRL